MTTVEGPYFDELERGQVFESAPYELTEGRAALHQAIVGDRLRLHLSDRLARQVTGRASAHPAFVVNVAIGQSTAATQHVKANLFYRHLALHRLPALGDTIETTTEVVGLRENARREGRSPTGLAALRIRTVEHGGREVLDFYRCAMLPLRGDAPTGHADDLDQVGADRRPLDPLTAVRSWDLRHWPTRAPRLVPGETFELVGGDVVTSAPELARLTLNVARVHHEAEVAGGRRLVYGGHTIGLAAAHLARAVPDAVTILAWEGCDHVGPVHEDDVLTSTVEVVAVEQAGPYADVARLRVVSSVGAAVVLDWRVVVLVGRSGLA